MSKEMRAAVLVEAGHVQIQVLPRPEAGPDEVLIHPRTVGICGSDMHLYRHGRVGERILQAPQILGHEVAGDVVSVGSSVKDLAAGDRVIVEPGLPCGVCTYCTSGQYNLCPHGRFMGVPSTPGFLAEYAVVPARWVLKLPPNLDYVEGAMIEPFAVGLMAAKVGDFRAGQSIAILGAGPIGLMVAQAARIYGARPIISVDVAEEPLKLAAAAGATDTIDARQSDVPARVREITGGSGADIVVEAVGIRQTMQQSLLLARRGGTVVLVGNSDEPLIPMNVTTLVRSGLIVKGCIRYANVHRLAISFAEQGRVDLKSLVTHAFSFEQTAEALRYVAEHKDRVVKAVVTF